MDWETLLLAERLGDEARTAQRSRSSFAQDYDRIIFSAPFRRLANKTQVQPLYENDHVHHRLIHSVEVSSVGRSLAMRVGHWLADEQKILERQVPDLADVVQAACVAHDIGNPPFGHSGEAAMGAWFAEQFAGTGALATALDPALHAEFTDFEGNAQGFRILTRLEMYRGQTGMRLAKATLGAFTKYPVTAPDRLVVVPDKATPAPYIGLKKFGIFRSDLPQFRDVARGLGLPVRMRDGVTYWARHPLVFLMEAADDITYNIVDLEDAFTTGELSFDTVRDILSEVAGLPKGAASSAGRTESEEIAYLRARSIGRAVVACTTAFTEHHDAILDGSFSRDLISASLLGPVFARIRQLAGERIFTAPRKTELEISGRRIIANVMSGILPVYEDLARVDWDEARLSDHSKQLVRALSLDLREVRDAESALHALADFTSGMTDRYALRISRMLSGT
ncbi:dGTP triphosphohydrolase [Paracoccus aminophilus]|uniref:Deoxyguanosinetriphosphate triphosphohydrolase n=1 Tax=Paracoccus aminophilus JCM 7686 TaxID=1367847 RepID=S5Y110_PARAH|nr:dNTP triphosphohydrolase [Paracoccus aminophilus]AGT11182.1 deoxyguanosinetriphosphate triphosphohydrolase [Paracoccus aminophilus JCM 7686]